jgi:hypothetical protein
MHPSYHARPLDANRIVVYITQWPVGFRSAVRVGWPVPGCSVRSVAPRPGGPFQARVRVGIDARSVRCYHKAEAFASVDCRDTP